MKKLIGNKRGVDLFTLIVTIIGISTLMLILIGLTMKYNLLFDTFKPVGSRAAFILEAYDDADGVLLYLDNAAKLSMQKAAYDLARNGFYSSASGSSDCGSTKDYVLWKKDDVKKVQNEQRCEPEILSCIPQDYYSFESYFNNELNSRITSYNGVSEFKLVQSNYELQLLQPAVTQDPSCSVAGQGCETSPCCPGQGLECRGTPGQEYCVATKPGNQLQLVGIAQQPLVIDRENLHYEVMPSFRENIDVDLIGDFGKITSKAEALIGKEEEELKATLTAYNDMNEGLRWILPVGGYKRDCSMGNKCYIEECTIDVEEEQCSPAPTPTSIAIPTPTPTSTATAVPTPTDECEMVTVQEPGKLVQRYCSVTANILVKVVDDKYKLPGDSEGYKKFVTIDGSGNPVVNEYAYRFALSWVEMGEIECV